MKGRPPIRPNPLDPGILDRICEGLIEGHSMKTVCEPADMPHFTMVYREMARNPDFATAIARAREAQQEAIIDSTIDLADEATPETVHVQKLKIWARQWRAAKLAPKKYSERMELDAKVEVTSGPTENLMSFLALIEKNGKGH